MLLLVEGDLVGGLDVAPVGLTFDPGEEVSHVSLEEGVLEFDFCDGALDLMKVVHVQLPHKRIQVFVLEEFWQSFVGKFVFVDNLETLAVLAPLNYAFLAWLTYDLVELIEEGGDLF